MKRRCFRFTFLTVAFSLGTVFAQSGDFTTKGKVVSSAGTPLEGVTASYTSVAKRLSWDFSNANGLFGLGATSLIRQTRASTSMNIAKGPVSIELFDMSGRKIETLRYDNVDKGTYSIAPIANKLHSALYLMKISTSGNHYFEKLFVSGNGKYSRNTMSESNSSIPLELAKKAAVVDTVRICKTGYAPVKVPVESYTSDIGTVTLAPVNVDSLATALLGTLSQAEKVGQVVQVVFPGTGSVTGSLLGTVFGGGSDGPGGGAGSAGEWATFTNGYQAAALTTNKKIPLLIGVDVVHGFGKCRGATVIPHNIGLGCTFDPTIVQKCHRVAGLESRAGGVNFVFGPCVAVPRNDKWGRVYEGFSESPDLTKEMARAAVLGFQLSDLSNPNVVAACTKHFAGDGGTDGGADRGNTTGDDAKLRAIHLAGYTAAVQAGTASIMASFSAWNGVRMHENKTLLTDWLKTEQKFDGFVNGDWDGHTVYTSSPENCVKAGLDVPMKGSGADGIPSLQTIFNNLYSTNNGPRVDDAVKRLLRVKFKMGLFSTPLVVNSALTATVGSQPHRDIAREAVRKSMVLLKTSPGLLPLGKDAKITLVGQHSQDIGLQCGGWTLGWQGGPGNSMPGTTIRKGFEDIGGAGNISYSADGTGITGDVTVVCIGEQPYAEMVGDKADLAIPGAALITAAKASGKKVICVMITGRPMDISAIADKCDAIVAAWLPGTEGGGVAEVLYGNYEFRGKLSMSWPRTTAQEPVNVGDVGYDPLYAYDFGLNAAGQVLPKGIY